MKTNSFLLQLVWYCIYCYGVGLSGNILYICTVRLELELEPKLGTKVEPEPKINNFGSATLI